MNKTKTQGQPHNNKNGKLKIDSKDNVDILNNQFKSVFTIDK